MAGELTIGKLAKFAKVNIETIRCYQRRGLLDEPPKPLGGHRRYAGTSQAGTIHQASAGPRLHAG
jgi:hypothetical protein